MKGRIGRKVGGTSVVAMLVGAAMLVGVGMAWAVTNAMLVQTVTTGSWDPPSDEPSGVAYIDSGDYLFVVDTNAAMNNPNENGWQYDIASGTVSNRATGVPEPSGIDYDPVTNTLFITRDNGHVFVFTGFDTPQQQMVDINVTAYSFDTEDPAYDRNNGRLYFLDGDDNNLLEINPVNGWGGGNDIVTVRSIDNLNTSPESGWDWEGLAWDSRTGNLLVGYSQIGNPVIYEVTFGNPVVLVNTINVTGITGLTRINGLGIAPASYDSSKSSLWVTDRNSSKMFEISFDGTTPPSTTSTSTTQQTTTTTQATTSTTAGTTTTTQGNTTTTTTQATTTTSSGGTTTTTTMGTTTTTIPGSTTTTTQPGGGGTNPFVDDDGSVFENSIEWLAAAGITQGCNPPLNNRFCPNDRVTRGQMATFLVRALNYPGTSHDWFIDDESSVFENSINRLREAGVTQGCNPPDNSRYCPNSFVTRGQMAAFLDRAFGYSAGGSIDYFTDDNGHVFENAINRLRTARVTLGCNPPSNNRYCPNDFVTRGQMAAFLKRAMGG